LSVRDKETITAYASGLNACRYGFGVHSETVQAPGVTESLIEALLIDFGNAPVEPNLKPLLAPARVLTLAPTKAMQRRVDAVLAVGWTERVLNDLFLTVCLFNFMNRLLEGHGVKGSAELYAARGVALKEDDYAPLLAMRAAPNTPGPFGPGAPAETSCTVPAGRVPQRRMRTGTSLSRSKVEVVLPTISCRSRECP
jgi:hypothetical protein